LIFSDSANDMTDDEIAADAISFNVKVTDENTGRTMIFWSYAATKHAAINGLRALVMEIMDTKALATTAGEVMLEFS
jgi:hypothetical protein